MTLDQLKTAAAELPQADRADLAAHLIRSINAGDADEGAVRAEWLALAEERMIAVRAGGVVGVPADEVLRTLLGPGR